MGFLQGKLLRALVDIARATRHALGVYYATAPSADGGRDPVYIHSKAMIVDDRFFTVGSANTTNRSMGLDTELNVAWEAGSPDDDDGAAAPTAAPYSPVTLSVAARA